MKFDWKFYIMLLVTIIGIAIPIWLWQADIRGKSLKVQLMSSVDLQIIEPKTIPDLQITIGGVAVKSPTLSILELSNDGSKPISTNDFEGVIELHITQPSKILRANVLNSNPEGLPAQIDVTEKTIKIRPLLLNPGDRFKISVISSGNSPEFTPRARISGVSSIKYENETTVTRSPIFIIWQTTLGFLSMVLYGLFAALVARPHAVQLTRISAIPALLCFGVLSSSSFNNIYIALDIEHNLINMLPLFATLVVVYSFIFYKTLYKSPKEKTS